MHRPEKSANPHLDVRTQERAYRIHVQNITRSKGLVDTTHPPVCLHTTVARDLATRERQRTLDMSTRIYAGIPRSLKADVIEKRSNLKSLEDGKKFHMSKPPKANEDMQNDMTIITRPNWVKEIRMEARGVKSPVKRLAEEPQVYDDDDDVYPDPHEVVGEDPSDEDDDSVDELSERRLASCVRMRLKKYRQIKRGSTTDESTESESHRMLKVQSGMVVEDSPPRVRAVKESRDGQENWPSTIVRQKLKIPGFRSQNGPGGEEDDDEDQGGEESSVSDFALEDQNAKLCMYEPEQRQVSGSTGKVRGLQLIDGMKCEEGDDMPGGKQEWGSMSASLLNVHKKKVGTPESPSGVRVWTNIGGKGDTSRVTRERFGKRDEFKDSSGRSSDNVMTTGSKQSAFHAAKAKTPRDGNMSGNVSGGYRAQKNRYGPKHKGAAIDQKQHDLVGATNSYDSQGSVHGGRSGSRQRDQIKREENSIYKTHETGPNDDRYGCGSAEQTDSGCVGQDVRLSYQSHDGQTGGRICASASARLVQTSSKERLQGRGSSGYGETDERSNDDSYTGGSTSRRNEVQQSRSSERTESEVSRSFDGPRDNGDDGRRTHRRDRRRGSRSSGRSESEPARKFVGLRHGSDEESRSREREEPSDFHSLACDEDESGRVLKGSKFNGGAGVRTPRRDGSLSNRSSTRHDSETSHDRDTERDIVLRRRERRSNDRLQDDEDVDDSTYLSGSGSVSRQSGRPASANGTPGRGPKPPLPWGRLQGQRNSASLGNSNSSSHIMVSKHIQTLGDVSASLTRPKTEMALHDTSDGVARGDDSVEDSSDFRNQHGSSRQQTTPLRDIQVSDQGKQNGVETGKGPARSCEYTEGDFRESDGPMTPGLGCGSPIGYENGSREYVYNSAVCNLSISDSMHQSTADGVLTVGPVGQVKERGLVKRSDGPIVLKYSKMKVGKRELEGMENVDDSRVSAPCPKRKKEVSKRPSSVTMRSNGAQTEIDTDAGWTWKWGYGSYRMSGSIKASASVKFGATVPLTPPRKMLMKHAASDGEPVGTDSNDGEECRSRKLKTTGAGTLRSNGDESSRLEVYNADDIQATAHDAKTGKAEKVDADVEAHMSDNRPDSGRSKKKDASVDVDQSHNGSKIGLVITPIDALSVNVRAGQNDHMCENGTIERGVPARSDKPGDSDSADDQNSIDPVDELMLVDPDTEGEVADQEDESEDVDEIHELSDETHLVEDVHDQPQRRRHVDSYATPTELSATDDALVVSVTGCVDAWTPSPGPEGYIPVELSDVLALDSEPQAPPRGLRDTRTLSELKERFYERDAHVEGTFANLRDRRVFHKTDITKPYDQGQTGRSSTRNHVSSRVTSRGVPSPATKKNDRRCVRVLIND